MLIAVRSSGLNPVARRRERVPLNGPVAIPTETARRDHCSTGRARVCSWQALDVDGTRPDRAAIVLADAAFPLATMLRVRRASVTVAAGALQKAGLIHYHLGSVTMLDHKGLEAAACACYRYLAGESDRLIGE